jgi:HK97 family phage portal protein
MKLQPLDLTEAKASMAALQQERIKMSTESSTLDNPSAALIEALIGFPTAAGTIVTRDTAIRIVSFLSGVKMLCNDIAKMPLVLMETSLVNGQQRTRKAIANSLYSVLKDVPNQWMTSYQMRWFNAFQLITNGNFYNQVIRNGVGEVLQINPLNAWYMLQRWDLSDPKNPQLFFDYNDGRQKRTFKQSDIWHTSIMNIGGVEGLSIIALAKEALSVLMASDETAGRFFANGLNMAGFLTSSSPEVQIDEPTAQSVVDRLKKDFSGSRNAGKFSFLPGGIKYEKMAFTAVEGQLLESRKWNAEEVIRLLGGAPLLVKLGYGDKNTTYASSSAFLDEYFNTSLLPFTINIEQSIVRDLIDPQDRGKLFAKHSADIILRGSPKERAETYKIQISSGQRTPNETRIMDDQDPIEGADMLFFPSGSGVFDPETGEIFIPGQQASGQAPDESPAEDQQDTAPESPTEDKQDTKAVARLLAIANALADRVQRKESKGGTVDAKFIADVMNVSLEKAEEYCQKRKNGEITDENVRAALIALAQGE